MNKTKSKRDNSFINHSCFGCKHFSTQIKSNLIHKMTFTSEHSTAQITQRRDEYLHNSLCNEAVNEETNRSFIFIFNSFCNCDKMETTKCMKLKVACDITRRVSKAPLAI